MELSVEVVAFRRMRFSELLAPSSPESVFLRFGGRSFFWDASSKGGAAGGSLGVVESAEAAGGSARSEVMASWAEGVEGGFSLSAVKKGWSLWACCSSIMGRGAMRGAREPIGKKSVT